MHTVMADHGSLRWRIGRCWPAAYWRANLTLRHLAPLFGVSKSAAARVIHDFGPKLALQPRRRFAKNTVLIVDGTLMPTRDHAVAEQSKSYRYPANH